MHAYTKGTLRFNFLWGNSKATSAKFQLAGNSRLWKVWNYEIKSIISVTDFYYHLYMPCAYNYIFLSQDLYKITEMMWLCQSKAFD